MAALKGTLYVDAPLSRVRYDDAHLHEYIIDVMHCVDYKWKNHEMMVMAEKASISMARRAGKCRQTDQRKDWTYVKEILQVLAGLYTL